ncbi:hypothetical protein ERAQ111492_06815 [Erysipelothrix aquatica]
MFSNLTPVNYHGYFLILSVLYLKYTIDVEDYMILERFNKEEYEDQFEKFIYNSRLMRNEDNQWFVGENRQISFLSIN